MNKFTQALNVIRPTIFIFCTTATLLPNHGKYVCHKKTIPDPHIECHTDAPKKPQRVNKNNNPKKNCPSGGTAYSGSYVICEVRESFHDVHASLESLQDSADNINTSVNEVNCSGLDIIQSIAEDISDRIPCTCDITIRQSDLVAGSYSINNPGTYCICENLQGPGGTTVVNITTGNVTLDLCGHTIDGGGGNACIGINPTSGSSHVYVKDGNVINASSGVEIASGTDVDAWTIENIRAVGTTTLPTTTGIYVNDSSNGLIKQISTDGCGIGIKIGNEGTASNILVDDCVVRNSKTTDVQVAGGFLVNADNTSNITFNNCTALTGASNGFIVLNCAEAIFKDCISIANTEIGYLILNPSTNTKIVLKKCISLDDKLKCFDAHSDSYMEHVTIKKCNFVQAEDNITGFTVELENVQNTFISDTIAIIATENSRCFNFNSDSNIVGDLSVSLRNCAAFGTHDEYSTVGFYLGSTTGSSESHILIEQCLAQNLGFGFQLHQPTNSSKVHFIMRECSALSVAQHGFYVAYDNLYGILRNCLAVIDQDAPATSGNSAFFMQNFGLGSVSIESCTAIGLDSPLDAFLINGVQTAQQILRGNTASGFSGTGFNDSASKNAFFNNLARDNISGTTTSNFSGINFTPTAGTQGAYFVTNADGTTGTITPAFQPALAATTGYWANVADPQY